MPSPGIRPAHSTRQGTPESSTIHSQCTNPVPKPTEASTRSVSASSRSVSSAGTSAGTVWPISIGRSPG